MNVKGSARYDLPGIAEGRLCFTNPPGKGINYMLRISAQVRIKLVTQL